ncbi:response regulator [Oryzihumus leptocrescens]|uniref:Transcriptional regulatory protein n=1 Tax=Oryzihumus leptocrescens TaxID=297536 RepID=A0A542ZL28_9MICO|nr:response regulator [Oryzihumus leptocrescens]TQL61046.1 response regulator of citrate/malate metabolism [Oryzihumus leptocrescens]
MSGDLRVLVVEDEQVAADAHTAYVLRVPGFVVVGTARTGQAALQVLGDRPVDLVLLDMHLPDIAGLDVVRAMRAAGHRADVIAVTSARDLPTVRSAVSMGVVQYLLKPFAFASLRERLERYKDYRTQVDTAGSLATEHDLDQMLGGLRAGGPAHLPKGIAEESLAEVARVLRESPSGASASEVAERLGMSRVTARRYLEHLGDSGLALRRSRYAGPGRPEVEYRWGGG